MTKFEAFRFLFEPRTGWRSDDDCRQAFEAFEASGQKEPLRRGGQLTPSDRGVLLELYGELAAYDPGEHRPGNPVMQPLVANELTALTKAIRLVLNAEVER
jgi:hypothetical protein